MIEDSVKYSVETRVFKSCEDDSSEWLSKDGIKMHASEDTYFVKTYISFCKRSLVSQIDIQSPQR